MNHLDFPDEPDYVPKMIDLHLGAAEVKPLKKHIELKEHKNHLITFLNITVISLGFANAWLFVSVWKWIIT